MNCPQCQAALSDGARFCTSCGTSITRAGTPSSRPPERQTEVVNAYGVTEPAPFDPLIGRVLEAKYKLVSRLGEGGMGAVYRAKRVHIGDDVAVKVLHTKYVKEEAALERFRREARAAAMLHHPNVVAIYDYGEARTDDAPAFIVMELVSGLSLRGVLEREKKLAPERAVSLMRDICAGVGAAHRSNIIHRDLKPDNIIVLPAGSQSDNETGKVVDFGIAKLRDMASDQNLTQTGMVIGTPYYMSPEQCKADPLDARSDVYSLGAMLYEMLAGQPPFMANTVTGVVAKHLTEAPPPMPQNLGVSPALEAVIMRSLAKDPNARQADASVFARELQSVMTHGATQPISPGFTDRAGGGSVPTQVVQAPFTAPYTMPQPQPAAYQTPYPAQINTQPPAPAPARSSRAGLIAGVASAAIILLLAAAAYWIFIGSKRDEQRPSSVTPPNPSQNAAQPVAPVSQPNPGQTDQSANAPPLPADGKAKAEAKILNGAVLDKSDIAGVSVSDLRLLRNTVYARHGRVFDSDELQRYFNNRSWYRPRRDYSDSELTDADRANVNFLLSAEGGGAKPADASGAQKEVMAALNSWTDAIRAHDLDAYMSHYADTLAAYYRRSNVSSADVRADKAKAFDRFYSMEIQLGNIQITPDETGERATATFDKRWNFVGEKPFSGTVRQGLWLEKIGGRWRITAEKDL
ncbi:MAG TPA: protein kinase [Blastocatellia bacterium]|nr:protein kinase [Blastocatellia bacterium]